MPFSFKTLFSAALLAASAEALELGSGTAPRYFTTYAPSYKVNRLNNRAEDKDLRYASCRVHSAINEDYRIVDRYLRGTVFVEQEYFGGAWSEPNSYMVLEKLRDGLGADPQYSMSTIETKNINVGNCQVIPISTGPPV